MEAMKAARRLFPGLICWQEANLEFVVDCLRFRDRTNFTDERLLEMLKKVADAFTKEQRQDIKIIAQAIIDFCAKE